MLIEDGALVAAAIALIAAYYALVFGRGRRP
jgi:hypothetical protein